MMLREIFNLDKKKLGQMTEELAARHHKAEAEVAPAVAEEAVDVQTITIE